MNKHIQLSNFSVRHNVHRWEPRVKKHTEKCLIALLIGVCFFFSFAIDAQAKVKEKIAYRIIDSNSGKPIEVLDGSFDNGAVIQLGDREEGNKSQMFFLEESDGGMLIKAAHTLSLVSVKKSSFKDFAEIVQWENEDLKSMKWKVSENGDGTVSFKNNNSGKMLDVSGGKKSEGTPLQQYTSDDTDSQKFKLEEVTVEEMSEANRKATNTIKTTSDKVFRIVNAQSKKVLDVRDESSENGTLLQLWSSKTENKNQMFRFRKQDDGCYAIVALHSSKALEVGGLSKELSATINQWTLKKDYAPQMWKMIELSGNKFILCNYNSGLVVDVYGGDLSNGQQITQYAYNGSGAQVFYLEEVSKKDYED